MCPGMGVHTDMHACVHTHNSDNYNTSYKLSACKFLVVSEMYREIAIGTGFIKAQQSNTRCKTTRREVNVSSKTPSWYDLTSAARYDISEIFCPGLSFLDAVPETEWLEV